MILIRKVDLVDGNKVVLNDSESFEFKASNFNNDDLVFVISENVVLPKKYQKYIFGRFTYEHLENKVKTAEKTLIPVKELYPVGVYDSNMNLVHFDFSKENKTDYSYLFNAEYLNNKETSKKKSKEKRKSKSKKTNKENNDLLNDLNDVLNEVNESDGKELMRVENEDV